MRKDSPRSIIMMVDDGITNLELLKAILGSQGYDLRSFLNGAAALTAARSEPPDLILLDISMPEMDGYEVCRRLKSDTGLAGIPVIFISALTQTSDKVAAFSSGGVDYITKPLQAAEVKARVKAQLQLYHHQRNLAEKLERIRRLEELRDNLTHMVAHDMRSPIGNMAVALQLLEHQLAGPEERVSQTLKILETNVDQLTRMVDQMLDMSRMESGQMPIERAPYDIVAQIRKMVEAHQAIKHSGRIVFEAAGPELVFADQDIIGRVIGNLVQNALKFSSVREPVSISVTRPGERVRVAITDQGPGISPADQQKIFEKFVQLNGRERKSGAGLGLAFCKMAVETHGGVIGVESEPGKGTAFWFELPAQALP